MVFVIVQTLVVVMAGLAAALYAFRRFAPRTASRAQASIGRRLAGGNLPGWLKNLGARWAQDLGAPSCDSCSSCSGCDISVRRTMQLRRRMRPLDNQ